jgi:demethylmenaquinone methyltransferase/2-methoxy-6-polyprenyl-1,4-benzoquinol methylase
MAIDFDAWATTYDDTRAASPSVLRPVLDALGAPAGRALLDIGGGTGNFAAPLEAAGFAVTLCDLAPAMARRAGSKLPRALAADARRLPFRDAAIDCAVSVNVLRHIPDRVAAMREALRVLRAGPLVVKVSTAETLRGEWLHEYIPRLVEHQPAYQPESEIVAELRAAGFARVDVRRFIYTDVVDGSFQAIKHDPRALLDDATVMNTAVLQRVPPDELRAGLDAIRADVASGRVATVIARYEPLRREYGDGSIFVAWPGARA